LQSRNKWQKCNNTQQEKERLGGEERGAAVTRRAEESELRQSETHSKRMLAVNLSDFPQPQKQHSIPFFVAFSLALTLTLSLSLSLILSFCIFDFSFLII